MSATNLHESIGTTVIGSQEGSVRTLFCFGRADVFLIVLVVLSANSVWSVITGVIERSGLTRAIINSFDISLIVWAALYFAFDFLFNAKAKICLRFDKYIAGFAILIAFLPIGPASWIMVSAVAIYLIITSTNDENLRRAGWLFLSLTVPVFWGRRIMTLFSDYILSIDAYLVSFVTQTARQGNVVAMPDGAGALVIASACSSMANISLAILCWTLFSQIHGLKWCLRNLLWCFLGCASVALVNITRIAIIGYFPNHYTFLHDGFGVTIDSWLTVLVCFLICRFGVEYEKAHSA